MRRNPNAPPTCGLLLGALLAFVPACGADPIGTTCQGPSDVLSLFPDFVQIGSFGGRWPATVQRVKSGHHQLLFTRRNGMPHLYPGYTGYDLKAVFLDDDEGNETVLVLRSKAKTMDL